MNVRPHDVLAFLGATVLALATATALDALGLGRMQSLAERVELGAIAAALGAVQGALWPWLLAKRKSGRAAAVGALVGGTTAFLLVRSTLPWLDLGTIAAGPPGELPLVVLPLASVIAVGATFRRGADSRLSAS
jgi:hypothetical protein